MLSLPTNCRRPVLNEHLLKKISELPGTIITFSEEDLFSSSEREMRIYSSGTGEADAFFVLSGMVQLEHLPNYDKKIIYDFCGKGEFFGDLIDSNVYYEDAVTVSPTSVKRIAYDTFVDYGLESFINKTARENIVRQIMIRNTMSSGYQINDRLIIAFFLLAERFRDRYSADGKIVTLPLRNADLASFIGTSREAVSQRLTSFRKSKVLIPNKNREISIDFNKAKDLYDFLMS